MFPYPKPDMRYAFFLPTATTDTRSSMSSLGRELDNSKCLLDYGFTNSTKSISLELARCPNLAQQPNPLLLQVPSPSSGLLLMPTAVSPAALHNLMCLYITVARDVVDNGKDTMQALKEATAATASEGSSPLPSSSSGHGHPAAVIAQSSIFGKRTHENRKDSREGDKRTKAAAEPTDFPAKIQKLPSAATSSASPMFKGLRKGFLSSSGATDGSSAAESKKSDGLFSGMKKGFLASGGSKASQKHKKSAP
jgi:hypothetical protein